MKLLLLTIIPQIIQSIVLQDIQKKNPGRKLIVINTDNILGGKGKSNALNIALSVASGTVIAIYDADNTPAPDALGLLVENLMDDEKLGAVIGKFRTRNRKRIHTDTFC